MIVLDRRTKGEKRAKKFVEVFKEDAFKKELVFAKKAKRAAVKHRGKVVVVLLGEFGLPFRLTAA